MSKKRYNYSESGLPNIFIDNVSYVENDRGEIIYKLGTIKVINALIAFSLLVKPFGLSGKEVKFLRKFMRLTQDGLGNLLSKSRITVNRWEQNTLALDRNAEIVLRLAAFETVKSAQLLDLSVFQPLSIDEMSNLPDFTEETPYEIQFKFDDEGKEVVLESTKLRA